MHELLLRHPMRAVRTGLLALLLAIALIWSAALPANAWKPHDHIYAANRAIELILSGVNAVEVDGRTYQVDPRVADAIRSYPTAYRAGVIGPDGFPDLYVGQKCIHPDTITENGTLSGNDVHLDAGHSQTYEWLRHVYEAGWSYYNQYIGSNPAAAKQALAFSYGYLTHAAGDMWGHTLINDIARGIAPGLSDLSRLPILLRHLIAEIYIGTKTPPTDLTVQAPTDFVHQALVVDARNGGFIDSANEDAVLLGNGAIFKFFNGLRNALADGESALEAIGPIDPLYIVAQAAEPFIKDWISQIDTGLTQWPGVSNDIARLILATHNPDYDAAANRVGQFLPQVLRMLGIDDAIQEVLGFIGAVYDELYSLIDNPVLDAIGNGAVRLVDWLLQEIAGFSIDDFKALFVNPQTHVNDATYGFFPNTSAILDGLMGIQPGGTTYNPDTFAAMKNTITTSKLILMSPDELNHLLYDHRVGPIYSADYPHSDRANVLLGWIFTIDGHSQWRRGTFKNYENSPPGTQYSSGMPLWNDCLSRDRLFRVIYSDWQNNNFPDLGEDALDISATPPPTSNLAIIGNFVASGGSVFVGGGTTFTASGVQDHYWNANEITVAGRITPGKGQSASGSVNLGSLIGPDGTYKIEYQATGICTEGPGHAEALRSALFILDSTPPAVSVTSPTQGQVLDVVDMATASYSTIDSGSGLASSSAQFDGSSIQSGATIDAFLLNAGDHHLVVNAADKLGNAGSVDRAFSVHATIAGLKSAVSRAVTQGLITPPGNIDTYIQKKLDDAQAALTAGKKDQALNALSSAANKASASSGKGVDPTFDTRFVGWINDLMARL